jgi:DNA-binding CsgD family transcriptional regulator
MDALAMAVTESPSTRERRWGGEHSFWSRVEEGHEPAARLTDAILQRVLVAICVVDPHLSIVYVNDAARDEIRSSGCLAVYENALHARGDGAQGRLRRSVEGALLGRWALLDLAAGGATTAVAVVPLGEPGYALLVFGLRSLSHELAISFFVQAHGMTVTEGRVLRGLAEGLSPKQIAREHGVAVSTVRSQILRVRERTRTQSIRELVRAVSQLPPVMPACHAVA